MNGSITTQPGSPTVEPREILREAAMAALREAGADLRRRGWPCELIVDYVAETQTYAISLRIETPVMLIPIEAGRG